jgi:modulator of FtsH protease HflC
MKKNIIVLLIIFFVLAFFAYQNSRYVLADNDQVVITQFGRVVGDTKTVPGEYFKIPFIQNTHYFLKNLYLSESSQEIPTKDKKFILFTNKAFYKIADPVAFYKKLNSYDLAKEFVFDHTGLAERKFVTSHTLNEIIGNVDLKHKLEGIDCNPNFEYQIFQIAQESIKVAGAGIELNNIEAKVTYPINTGTP